MKNLIAICNISNLSIYMIYIFNLYIKCTTINALLDKLLGYHQGLLNLYFFRFCLDHLLKKMNGSLKYKHITLNN